MSTSIPSFPQEQMPVADFPTQTSTIGSLWHRFGAYVVDGIILGAVGSGVGNAFFEKLTHLGPWGRLVGFSIAVAYFAILESEVGAGQSIGKRLAKLRVVNAEGNTLTIQQSLVRCVVFAVPCFLFNLGLPEARTPWIVSSLISAVVYGVGGSTLFLLTFNRDTRQGLHDLSVGSYVVNANDSGPVDARPIATKHWAVLGSLLALFAVLAGIQINIMAKRGSMLQMRQDAGMIEQLDGVQRARVRDFLLHNRSGGGAKKTLIFSIRTEKPVDQESFADVVAKTVLQNDQYAKDYDQLTIQIFRGYDIGIASHWNHEDFEHTPEEWRERVHLGSPVTSSKPTNP